MNLFGDKWKDPTGWRQPAAPFVPVPVGAKCFQCDELIAAEDSGVEYDEGDVAHINCHLRGFIGSAAHVLKRCACYVPGSEETDDPKLSRRKQADAAVTLFEKMQKCSLN